MTASNYRYESISVRQDPRGGIQATHARLDQGSNRMVFSHLAYLVGDMTAPLDVADALAYAAQIHSARVAEEHRHARQAPAGG